jgi:hypothetical protein
VVRRRRGWCHACGEQRRDRQQANAVKPVHGRFTASGTVTTTGHHENRRLVGGDGDDYRTDRGGSTGKSGAQTNGRKEPRAGCRYTLRLPKKGMEPCVFMTRASCLL